MKVRITADIQNQIEELSVRILNADNELETFNGTKVVDGSFQVEVPNTHFGHFGFVRQGIQIWVKLTGDDEPFCLAFADLDIAKINPTAVPGRGTWIELKLAMDALEGKVSSVEQQIFTKITDPESKEEGQVLTYDGEKWIATDLPEPEDPTKLYSEDRSEYLTHNGKHFKVNGESTEQDYKFAKTSDLDDVVKYRNDEHMDVDFNEENHIVRLNINDSEVAPGNSRIRFRKGANYISRNAIRIGIPDNDETPEKIGDTHVTLGGAHNDAYVDIGGGITIYSSKEKGKSKMFMDDDRIFVTTPITVEEGQTLRAIKVANEPEDEQSEEVSPQSGEDEPQQRQPKLFSAPMKQRGAGVDGEEGVDWHWEYESADLPTKVSELENDEGFVAEAEVSELTEKKRDKGDLAFDRVNLANEDGVFYNISGFTVTHPTEGTHECSKLQGSYFLEEEEVVGSLAIRFFVNDPHAVEIWKKGVEGYAWVDGGRIADYTTGEANISDYHLTWEGIADKLGLDSDLANKRSKTDLSYRNADVHDGVSGYIVQIRGNVIKETLNMFDPTTSMWRKQLEEYNGFAVKQINNTLELWRVGDDMHSPVDYKVFNIGARSDGTRYWAGYINEPGATFDWYVAELTANDSLQTSSSTRSNDVANLVPTFNQVSQWVNARGYATTSYVDDHASKTTIRTWAD